ncbi:MAG: hypothetical protein M3037_08365 [Gemmatimonadota bacterium]|nr:hypothetical protein [Gemmatimonadota bacterium]
MDRHRKDEPTGQYSINEAEWENLANWWGDLYHSKRDDRLLVPSRFGPQGYTINVARPLARAEAIAILSLAIAGIIRAALAR